MISIPRLPFKEDKVFSVLVLLTLVIPLVFGWFLNEKFETIKLAFWLILFGWAAFLFFSKQELYFFNKPLKFLFFGFIFFGFLSSLFSVDYLNGFFGFYPRFTSGFLFYCLWAVTLLVFLAALEKPKWEFLAKVIFFDALVVAIVGLMQSFGVGYYEGIEQAFISRAPGLLGNPNFSAMFIVTVMPLVLPLIKYTKNIKAKIYYATAAFIMLWGVVNFSSRGAFLALFFGLLAILLFIFFLGLSKKVSILSLLTIILATSLATGFLEVTRPGSISSIVKLTDSNVDTRLFAWDVASRAVLSHPFLGYGPGSLQIYFERFRDTNLSRQSGVFDDAHNAFLQMAATTGLPFAICFLGILFLGFWAGYKNFKTEKKDFWTAGLLASLVVWIIAAMFNPVSTANYFCLIILLSGLMLNFVKSTERVIPIVYKGLLFFICLVISISGIIFLTAEIFYYKGLESYLAQDFVKSSKQLKRAIKLNPTNQLYYLYNTADEIILSPNTNVLEKDINKIISLHPESSKSQVMAANLYYLMYDRTKDRKFLKLAIMRMNESLKFDKLFPNRYSHVAFYLAEDGQLPLAREYLKTSLMFDESLLPSWLLLARVYQLEEKPVQMRFALNEAFKLRPTDALLKQLNLDSKKDSTFKTLKIPALINILQIEP